MSETHIVWAVGGAATATRVEGERITLMSTIPSAPGSRPHGMLPSGGALRVKVARCRKQDVGFLIEGRLIDTTRKVRNELEHLVRGDPGFCSDQGSFQALPESQRRTDP